MTGFTKFRSSMGGFNRVDVTNYIENLCAEHTAALKKLEKENAGLSERLDRTESELQASAAQNEELQQKLSQVETVLSSTEAALEEAMALVVAEPAETEPAPDYTALELEAYRRAEATERLAAERAAAMQQQLQDLLEQTADRYGETGQEVRALTEDLRSNLQRLSEALSDLDVIFDETSDRFDTLEAASETE